MIDQLCDQIWSHKKFHNEKLELQLSSISYTLNNSNFSKKNFNRIARIIPRLMECATILAKAEKEEYRKISYELAVSAWNIFGNQNAKGFFDKDFLTNCISTIFSRLGNFPANDYLLNKIGQEAFNSIPLQLWFEHENHVIENQVEFTELEKLTLTDFQRDLWYALSTKGIVVVSAPTSAGKSFAMQHYLVSQILNGECLIAAYVVPTRALISQVSNDINRTLSKYDKKIIVTEVPTEVSQDQKGGLLYVLTQERLQILLSQSNINIDFIIIDEAQGISDSSRGVILQSVVEKALEEKQPSKLLFGAPFVRNPNIFLETFGFNGQNTKIVDTVGSPVSQNLLHLKTSEIDTSRVSISLITDGDNEYGITTLDIGTELIQDNITLANIAYHFGKDSQNIVFGSEPANCEKLCQLLTGLYALDNNENESKNEELKEFSEIIRTHIHKKFSLAQFIDNGIAFHYSKLPSFIRRGIQSLLSSGHISYVVCTSTLLQGINLPAKNIFLLKPSKGGGWGEGSVPISSTEFWNLVGRAGRLTKDFEGNIYLIDIDKWEDDPIHGEKLIDVKPSLWTHLCRDTNKLLNFIEDHEHPSGRLAGLENSFMKLFNDYKHGKLEQTLDRYKRDLNSKDRAKIFKTIELAGLDITVPDEIAEANPNISIFRQQEMFDYLLTKLKKESPIILIPPHPLRTDQSTYQLYLRLFKRIHNHFEKKEKSNKSHLYFASLALKWMRGQSYSELLKKRLEYRKKKRRRGEPNVNTEARGLFDEIENDLRFRYVKFTKCYIDLLSHALVTTHQKKLCAKIPPIYLFLELGASSMTMMSLIGLGISRTGSAIISNHAPKTDMDRNNIIAWLKRINIDSLDLPTLVKNEVKLIM